MSITQAVNLRALNVLRYNLPQLHACEPFVPRILSGGYARYSAARLRAVYVDPTPHYEDSED